MDVVVEEIKQSIASDDLSVILDILSDAFNYTEEKPLNINHARIALAEISYQNGHIFVIKLGGKIIGAATLFVIQHLIHGGDRSGEIQDVAISKDVRGYGYGRKLIQKVTEIAREKYGVYKVVLSCSPYNQKFYEKCGYRHTSCTMRRDWY